MSDYSDDEGIKPLSDKDKSLISSNELSKSFENFVIKTIVNKKLNRDFKPKKSIKHYSTNEKIHPEDWKRKEKENKQKYDTKERYLVDKKLGSLKSVVSAIRLASNRHSLKNYTRKFEQEDVNYYLNDLSSNYRSDIDNGSRKSKYVADNNRRSKYDNVDKSYSHRHSDHNKSVYKRRNESPSNKIKKRTIGSLLDKYDDSKKWTYNDSYQDECKAKKSKSMSSNDNSEILKKLKTRFEDQPIENKYYTGSDFYGKNKIPLYSEHDDRFYKNSDASFKMPIDQNKKNLFYSSHNPAGTYPNYQKFYYYDKNPDIYSYYNPAAYYDPLYQQPNFVNMEAYHYKYKNNNPANTNAIYGGIADFQDSFIMKSESIVKPEPGEHITYNKDCTSISLKYEETFDSHDNNSSDSEHEERKRSKKKKSKKSKKSKKKKVPTATLR